MQEEKKDLLANLIEAEAGGEPYGGKVAVAAVVFNRLKSELFPNEVKSIIYQEGQFTPVANGKIDEQEPSTETFQAICEAYENGSEVGDALFFMNPDTTTSFWARENRPYITKIGNHEFYG